MYYETKIVDRKLYFRLTPHGDWILGDYDRVIEALLMEQKENEKLNRKIYELENYEGPHCKYCGGSGKALIPLSTRVQCAQCWKIFTVK